MTLAARIDELEATVAGLREQLARQARLVAAAETLLKAAEEDESEPGEWMREWDAAEQALYAAVRALSVPAPPEAPTVDELPPGLTEAELDEAIRHRAAERWAAEIAAALAAPPEAPEVTG